MLKHLPKAFKNNFVIYKLNVCKISTKEPQLIYSGAPHKISVFKIKHCLYFKYILLILLYCKNVKNVKNFRLKFFQFFSDSYRIVMTAE